MNVSIVGIYRCQKKKCFHNYVVVVLGQMMKLFFCCMFYVPNLCLCWYVTSRGLLLVHRIHNTTDSGYSANVHADSPLCAVLLSCFAFYEDTTLKLMASSSTLWSLLAITILSFLSCLLFRW